MKEKSLCEKILALKAGQSFPITEKERAKVYELARSLKEAGQLNHEIKTMSTAAGFKAYAI